MRAALRSRTRGQAIVFAAIGMVTLIGGVALVVDIGVFFVIQRQMQNAADAAAMAAVWYSPVCNDPFQVPGGCQTTGPTPAGDCALPPHTLGNYDDGIACQVATQYATANLGGAATLCGGPTNAPRPTYVTLQPGFPISVPPSGSAHTYVVIIDCDASYWFGKILPGLPVTHHISTNARAAIGWRGPDGDLSSTVPTPPVLIARLYAP